jgi:hypothetical protein
VQLPPTILGFPSPFFEYHPSTFFLEMLPYALVLVAPCSAKPCASGSGALRIPYA